MIITLDCNTCFFDRYNCPYYNNYVNNVDNLKIHCMDLADLLNVRCSHKVILKTDHLLYRKE